MPIIGGARGQGATGAGVRGGAAYATLATAITGITGSGGLTVTASVIQPATLSLGDSVVLIDNLSTGGATGQGARGASVRGGANVVRSGNFAGLHGLSVTTTLIYITSVQISHSSLLGGYTSSTYGQGGQGLRGKATRGSLLRGGSSAYTTVSYGAIPVTVSDTVSPTGSGGLSITAVVIQPAVVTTAGLGGLSVTTSIIPPVAASASLSSSSGLSVTTSIIPPVVTSVALGSGMTLSVATSVAATVATTGSAGLSVTVTIAYATSVALGGSASMDESVVDFATWINTVFVATGIPIPTFAVLDAQPRFAATGIPIPIFAAMRG